MSLRLPGLLAPNLSETFRLSPTAGSLTLKMYGSSEATLTLPEQEAEEKGVRIRDWISIYTEEGLAGIFRVTNVSQPLKKQVDLTLLHGIDILSDSVWGEQTDFNGTKQEFLTRLLNQQTQLINGVKPWVLGTCEDTATVKRSINYDRLNTLLEGLIEEGSDYYFTYDQTVFPWRLNYVRIDNQVMSEFRMAKNIRSATITYNDADLCTRLFLTVSSETEEVVPTKKLNPAWVSDTDTPSVPRIITENVTVSSVDSRIKMYENTAAQARWGIVVKTADIDTQDDIVNGHFESADAWAASFLARRSAPSVQIQVDGDDLSDLTGEPWDRARLARLCQVALPAYGETFRERVLSITWPELFKRPTHITLSLANTLPRFTESLAAAQTEAASASRSSRATARAQTKEEKEITTWSQHVQWQGAALDGSGIMTLYESGIDLDATGGAKIYSLENGLQGLYGELIVQSRRIDAKVGSDALQGLLHIDQLSTELGNVMTGSNGESIAATIVTKINDNQGTIYLNSDHVKLKDGSIITASTLDSRLANIDALFTTNGYAAQIKAGTINSGGNINADGAVYGTGIYIKSGTGGGTNVQYTDVSNAVKTIRKDTTLADGLIGFEFQTLTGTSWTKVNFNIADTSYYRAHVGIDAANLTLTEIGATPYNASDAAVVTGIEAGTADKYFLIAATPKDGDTVYKKFVLPAAAAPAVTTDPKISKKSWSSGQIQLDASSDPNDPSSVTIKLTGGTTGSLDSAANPTKISFDILESVNGSTVDTGADVVATVTRQAATLKLGTNSDNEPAIVANTPGKATVGGQVIQVGVTALKVTPGTATPNTPTWNSSTHKYAITADGSVSIGSDSLALTRGSLSGDFTPSNAFTYAFNQCYGSIGLSEASQELNPGDSVTIYPKAYSTYDVSINPNAQPQNITTKGITITAKAAATVTPKVSKKTWSSSGTLTFEASTASGDPTSAGVALGWVTVPNTSNGNAALSVVDKASPYSSAQPHTVLTKALTLTCEDDAAYLKDGGTTLAKVPNNKTADPVTVNVSKGSWSSGAIQFSTDPASGTGKNVSLGMTIPANTSNGNAQITIVDKASPGSSSQPLSTGLTKTLTLTCEDDAAYLKDGNTTVAKVPNNKTTPTVSASIDNITGSAIDDNNTRETVPISASGTNVTSRTEYAILKRDTSNRCVTLTMDGVVIGRISAQTFYTEGRNSVKITSVERVASCAFDHDAQKAEQDVRFTLSNGETYTIHEDFSDVYRAGRNGTSADTTIEYAVDLASDGVYFDTVDEGLTIDLSDIYQAGQSYTPPVLNWYTYSPTGGDVPIYVQSVGSSSGSSGSIGEAIGNLLTKFTVSTTIAFYPYTPVEVVGTLRGYTQVTYNGTTYLLDPSNLKESEDDLSIGHRIGIKDLTVTRTITLSRIVHTAGTSNSVTLTVQREGEKNPSNAVSSYVSLREFNNLTVNDNAGNYFDYLSYLSGYFASHDPQVYGDTINNKAVFTETYTENGETVTEYIIVSFDSYAYAAESQRVWWEITNYYNNYGFDTHVTFTPANGPEQTLAYSEGYSSLTVSGEDASTYIPGDITYAWNSNYYQQMTCRFRVRWHLSNGKTEDIIIKKVAHMEEAPSPDAFTGYVYATNGGSVKVRATAGGSEIGSLTPNTQVTVLSQEGSYYKIEFEGVQGYMVSSYVIKSSGSPSNYKYTGWVKDIAYVEIVVASNGSDQIVHAGGYTGTIVIDLAPAGMGKTNYRSLNAISALYNSFSPAITGSLSYYLGTVNNYGNLATHSKNIYKSNLTHRLRAIVHYADGSPSDSVILQFTSVPV